MMSCQNQLLNGYYVRIFSESYKFDFSIQETNIEL